MPGAGAAGRQPGGAWLSAAGRLGCVGFSRSSKGAPVWGRLLYSFSSLCSSAHSPSPGCASPPRHSSCPLPGSSSDPWSSGATAALSIWISPKTCTPTGKPPGRRGGQRGTPGWPVPGGRWCRAVPVSFRRVKTISAAIREFFSQARALRHVSLAGTKLPADAVR